MILDHGGDQKVHSQIAGRFEFLKLHSILALSFILAARNFHIRSKCRQNG